MNTDTFSNKLAKKIWPRNFAHNNTGSLMIHSNQISELVKKYGSPLLILDEEDFIKRCKKWSKHFPNQVYYASKAFNSSYIFKKVNEIGIKLEVCSYGELLLAIKSNFPTNRIGLHGNNKTYEELLLAITNNVEWIVIDAIDEIDQIETICKANNKTQKVLIRATTGIKVTTHEAIDTSVVDQKFGFSITNNSAFNAIQYLFSLKSKYIKFAGIHIHIGSKIFKRSEYKNAIVKTFAFIKKIKDVFDVEVDYLNIGGGFNSPATVDEKKFNIKSFSQLINRVLEKYTRDLKIKKPIILLEPGRSIISQSIVTVYSIGVIKDIDLGNSMKRRYINVNGGMSDNIRPMLYDAIYSCTLAEKKKGKKLLSRVVGHHCESGDILINDVYIPEKIKKGDLLLLANTGGYCRSLSSNYNLSLLPPVISVTKDESKEIIRRENYSDLFATDLFVDQ